MLQESGVVTGEFGFADLQARRKVLLESWLSDESEAVKAFAASQIHQLEQRIAAEVRAAEASIALRRLSHGEELDEATSSRPPSVEGSIDQRGRALDQLGLANQPSHYP